jgi:C1A family cysteine protease
MIRDGVKVLAKIGTCTEKEWAYNIAKFTTKPTAKAFTNALKNQALVYQRITRPSDDPTSHMLNCLDEGYPFVSGIAVYQSFETIETAHTGIIPLPGKAEALLGGHAILVVGYDLTKQHFICRNSWGSEWGDKGYFYLPFGYLSDDFLASDIWLIQSVEV